MGRDDSREVPIFTRFQDPFTKFDREESKVKGCSVTEARLQSFWRLFRFVDFGKVMTVKGWICEVVEDEGRMSGWWFAGLRWRCVSVATRS